MTDSIWGSSSANDGINFGDPSSPPIASRINFGNNGASDFAGMCISPDLSTIAIADFELLCVYIIDTGHGSLVTTISPGAAWAGGPYSVQFSPDGTLLYVVLYGTGASDSSGVSVVDTSDWTVSSTTAIVDAPNPSYLLNGTISIDGTKLYLSDLGNYQIQVFDTSTLTVTNTWQNGAIFEVGSTVASPDGAYLYCNDLANSIYRVDLSDGIQTGGVIYFSSDATDPYDIVITPDGATLYSLCVFNPGYSYPVLLIVDTASMTLTEVINLTDYYPNNQGIAISPDGSTVYIPGYNHILSQLGFAVLDTSTNTLGTMLTMVDPDGNAASQHVSVGPALSPHYFADAAFGMGLGAPVKDTFLIYNAEAAYGSGYGADPASVGPVYHAPAAFGMGGGVDPKLTFPYAAPAAYGSGFVPFFKDQFLTYESDAAMGMGFVADLADEFLTYEADAAFGMGFGVDTETDTAMEYTAKAAFGTGYGEPPELAIFINYHAQAAEGLGVVVYPETLIAYPVVPITPDDPGYEFTARSRTARAVATVIPAVTEAPEALNITPIWRSSETYPQPTVINGIPYADDTKAPWLPTKVMEKWAQQFRFVVNGFDVTYFRGLPTIPQSWSSQEPGGDASATIFFPGITIFDNLPLPFTYPSGEVIGIASTKTGSGYWQGSSDGLVLDYGDASFFPSAVGLLNAPVCGIDGHPSAYGYATVASDGGVFCYGAVPFVGSIPGGSTPPYSGPSIPLPAPIVDIALTATGNGYWLVDEIGQVYTFGDAAYYGNAAIVSGDNAVGICRSTGGDGYQIVSAQGRCYAQGDAGYHGNITSPDPIAGVGHWPGTGDGFVCVSTVGQVYGMGAASYYGNYAGGPLTEPMNGICYTPSGDGYWLTAGDGGVFSFGAATFYGSVPSGGTPAEGSLSWARLGSTVVISYIDMDGDEHTLFEGVMFDWEDNTGPGSIGMSVDCIGCIFQLDWYIAKPIMNLPFVGYAADSGLPIFGWDSGVAIANAINSAITSPSMGTALGVGVYPPAPTASPLKLNMCERVETGITTVQQGAWDQLFSSYIQNILSQMQADAIYQYTVQNARYTGGAPFTPAIVQKDFETVDWTVSSGAHGVADALSFDVSQAATAIYGSGQSPPIYTTTYQDDGDGSSSVTTTGVSGQWQNTKYPQAPPTAPAWPLGDDEAFVPGGADTGFQVFSNWMRQCGYPLQSQDTYVNAMIVGGGAVTTLDIYLIRQFQIMAGYPPSGLVDKALWNAAFTPGQNEGSIFSTFYQPLWELGAVEPHNFTPSGAYIGPSGTYNPQAIRVERYENMGQQIQKVQGTASAFVEGERIQNPSWTGTITLTSDPQEGSRYAMKAGDNILLRFFHGQDTLFHISAAEIDFADQSVSLTVSSMPQDLITIAATIARDASTYGVSRAARPSMVNLDISPNTTVFDAESSAGLIPPTYVPAGQWVVQRVGFSQSGSVAEVSLTASPDTTFAVAVFSAEVDASTLQSLIPTPQTDDVSGNSPWNDYAVQLDNLGMLYAAGGPDAMCGYYPNDPSTGTPTVTGKYIDGSTWSYFSAPGSSPWLWVALWATADAFINGNFLVAPPF